MNICKPGVTLISVILSQSSRETVLICTNPVKIEAVVCTRSIQIMVSHLMFIVTKQQKAEGGQ